MNDAASRSGDKKPEAGKFTTGSIKRHVLVMSASGAVGLISIFAVDLLSLLYISWLGNVNFTAGVGYATAVMFFSTSANVGMMIGLSALMLGFNIWCLDEVRGMDSAWTGAIQRLGKKFDIDHILPLCLSGTNDIRNLRALCKDCHEAETYKLITSGYNKNLHYTIESHLSPHMRRELHQAPKPQEVVYGLPWRERKNKKAKTQNVMDSLSQHPVPETSEAIAILGNVKDIYCLDAVKCRLDALTKRTRGLPVFCPLDDWEPFQLAKLPEYDFVFIDLGARFHRDTFPHTGSRPYAAEVCEWLLDKKIISACHCKFGLRASARVRTSRELFRSSERWLRASSSAASWRKSAGSNAAC
jgi:hypothetical protein